MLKDCEPVSQSVSEIIEYRAAASQLKTVEVFHDIQLFNLFSSLKMKTWGTRKLLQASSLQNNLTTAFLERISPQYLMLTLSAMAS